MSSKQLSALLRKAPPATAAASSPEPEKAATAAKRVVPEKQLHVLVPAHVRKQVALLAAEEGVSLRTIVLRGLREIGIKVTDDEIRGGHKRERTQ